MSHYNNNQQPGKYPRVYYSDHPAKPFYNRRETNHPNSNNFRCYDKKVEPNYQDEAEWLRSELRRKQRANDELRDLIKQKDEMINLLKSTISDKDNLLKMIKNQDDKNKKIREDYDYNGQITSPPRNITIRAPQSKSRSESSNSSPMYNPNSPPSLYRNEHLSSEVEEEEEEGEERN